MIDSNMSNIVFMALVIWREARGETEIGQTAVAWSILNRVAKPSWWGKTIMEVLFKRLQYSSMTDPRDKQLTVWPVDDAVWKQCLQMAYDVIHGLSKNPVPGADSYYDISIPPPKWATPDKFVIKIGRLNFYNMNSDVEGKP